MATSAKVLRRHYPAFDPTRLANWYGGIVRAIHAKGIDWAPIPALVARTLKGMNILTRQTRRAFLSTQIHKAIKGLCRLGILLEYKPGRVRINSQPRFERYLNSHPEAWPEKIIQEAPSSRQLGAEADPGAVEHNGATHKPAAQLEPSLARGLPPLRVAEDTDTGSAEEPSDSFNHTDSESNALGLLIGDKRSTGQESRILAESVKQSFVSSDIESIWSALQTALPEARLESINRGLRAKSATEVITVEARRDGSTRVSIMFSGNVLHPLLRYIRASWVQLVVGEDSQGQHSLLRSWPGGSSSQAIQHAIMGDLQVLDDVRSEPGEC